MNINQCLQVLTLVLMFLPTRNKSMYRNEMQLLFFVLDANCVDQWKLFNTEITQFPARIYLLKVNDKNTRASCEICSKLTIKTPERHH